MEAEEKFISSLEKAKRHLQIADHLTYMTFPIVRENKLLIKILEHLSNSIIETINAILQYEYIYKRIKLYTDSKENFKTFQRIAERYKISKEQLSKITEILTLEQSHKKSPFEFIKKDKIVIMSDNMKTDTITLEKIKLFIIETKDLIRKVSFIIKPIA